MRNEKTCCPTIMSDTAHCLAQQYSSVSVTFTNHITAPTHVRSFWRGVIPHTIQCTRTHATHNAKRYATCVNEGVISEKNGDRVSQLQDELVTPHSSTFLQSWQSLNWSRNSPTFTEPEDCSVHKFHQLTPLHQPRLVKHNIQLPHGIQVKKVLWVGIYTTINTYGAIGAVPRSLRASRCWLTGHTHAPRGFGPKEIVQGIDLTESWTGHRASITWKQSVKYLSLSKIGRLLSSPHPVLPTTSTWRVGNNGWFKNGSF